MAEEYSQKPLKLLFVICKKKKIKLKVNLKF